MKFFVKLFLLLGAPFCVLHSYELPKFLADEVAKLLENTMREEQNFESEQWLTGEIKNREQYEGVIKLRKDLLKTVLYSIPRKTLDILEVGEVSNLSDIQQEALALFSTQFEGVKIEMAKIQSSYLLAASLNVLGADEENTFSMEMLKKFVSYIPQEFLEGSEYH